MNLTRNRLGTLLKEDQEISTLLLKSGCEYEYRRLEECQESFLDFYEADLMKPKMGSNVDRETLFQNNKRLVLDREYKLWSSKYGVVWGYLGWIVFKSLLLALLNKLWEKLLSLDSVNGN